MRFFSIFLLNFLFISIWCKNPLNILVYSPVFATSHMNFMAHLADTLAEAGHNVTLFAPITDVNLRDRIGVKHTKNVIIVEQDDEMRGKVKPAEGTTEIFWIEPTPSDDFEKTFQWFQETQLESCKNQFRNKEIIENLKKTKFDVAIAEPLYVCGLALFYYLGITKTILSSSCVHYEHLLEHIGEPLDTSYNPALVGGKSDKMNILERYKNWKTIEDTNKCLIKGFNKEMEIYHDYLDSNIPHWSELLNSASLYFTNSNPYIDFPRPIIQKTVAIGGISVDMERIKSQKLDDQWNQILNQRNRNMLISFGSVCKSMEMPLHWKSNILSVIKTMPNVTFIWKYESDDLLWAHGANNIYFSKWVPQTALLADSRVNAFLTHGGLGSTNELAHCGKPALMVPVFGDQIRNSYMLARHNNVIVIDKDDLNNFEKLKNAIHSILYDQSYQKNAENLADLLANQPLSAKESVVKHTEFVAKFGPFPNMNSHARSLNFFQRNFLDIYFLIGFSYFLFTVLIFSIVRFLYSKLSIQIIRKTKKC